MANQNTYKHIQHPRSGTLNATPKAERLSQGEIAVNYAELGETLFIKNSRGNIVPFKALNSYDAPRRYLYEDDDLNDVVTVGSYICDDPDYCLPQTTLGENAPTWDCMFRLDVVDLGVDTIQQTFTNTTFGNSYVRTYADDLWSDWLTITTLKPAVGEPISIQTETQSLVLNTVPINRGGTGGTKPTSAASNLQVASYNNPPVTRTPLSEQTIGSWFITAKYNNEDDQPDSPEWGCVIRVHNSYLNGTSNFFQLVQTSTNNIYFRTMSNHEWSSWKTIGDDSDDVIDGGEYGYEDE